MPKRLREHEAKKILGEEIDRIGGGYENHLVRTDGPRSEANELDWWYSGNVEEQGAITKRTIAFFRAYERIAGELGLQAQGLLLEKGRVHMDKYVIRRLHHDGYLAFVKSAFSYFEITPSGRVLLDSAV